jgi:RHS repeat-associated protein
VTSARFHTAVPSPNRLSSQPAATYSYNSSNEVTAAGTATYTYDDNGNTLTKTDAVGTTTYNWDFENRLVSVQLPSSSTVSFKYDPFGRRIEKGTSVFVYDGANLIEESDTSGNMAARYAFGPGIDEPLAAYRGAASAFYEADGLNSITSLSGLSGNVSDSFVYDSFGNVASSTGSFTQPFRYTGREFDPETSLDYYRARYYDSAAGRFLSEDPLQFDGGINFYRYVGNRPTQFTDAFGLEQQCKSCGIEQAPEYDVNGAAPGGTTFHWSAKFKNDATHDPKCCEVRQLISWNQHVGGAPHGGFQAPRQA